MDDKIESGARAAAGLIRRLEGDPIPTVGYFFNVHGGPNPTWEVRRFHLTEGLSQTYELTVDILTAEVGTNSDEMVGANAQLDIDRGELLRSVCGVIHRVDFIGITHDKLLLRAYIVPALRLADQRIDHRIFQDMSVREILDDVLRKALEPYEREHDLELVSEKPEHYPKRDYCVQYGESDFDFVCRLMEEEGVAYFFTPDEDGKEKLHLIDQNADSPNAGYPECEVIEIAGDKQVPIIPDQPDTADKESLRFLDHYKCEQVNQVHVRGFNWKVPNPESPPEFKGEAEEDKVRELYVYTDRRKIVDEKAGQDPSSGFTGADIDEHEPMANRQGELFLATTRRGQGKSNVIGFSAGHVFQLAEHTREDLDGKDFLITRVIHIGDMPDVSRSADASDVPRYENTFECLLKEIGYRPPIVHRKPRVYGPQTATVTGPEGEEIHCDKHGRIKIRLHWDRVSKLDDTSSCWVRVAQMWSGPGWGTLYIPRIGMEVVVDFLAGNPDRPLVTGCVYNGTNPTPYTLPDEKTKSTMKSESSPGGGGFNEFRFEDAKDAEEIFLHAQKDFNEKVLNNHGTSVDNNQTHTVGNDRTRVVKGNENITIEGNQNITINGAPCHGDKGGSVKGKNVSIDGDYKLDTTSTVYFKATDKITFEVPNSTLVIEPGKISMTSGGKSCVVIDTKVGIESSGKSTAVYAGDITLKSSDAASLALTGDAKLKSSDGSSVALTADAKVTASTGASATYTADALICGAVATMDGGGATVKADGDINIGGGTVTIAGKSTVAIDGGGATGNFAGGTVKLN